ncbi:TonB-dependent receptor [Sphingomonas sp. S1-29]|uniref:TonB-dependent receptor n=1 Tax=Sphingomonas sp. S1-29 TaxID=2991074 RepID=UPI0022406A2B|nr:TonB-dependent receptor [Sphingomonas sp. S1-29]UZK70408.1 TonB-dependent receptor [Sphingomonas sp. S1-29]
MSPDPSIIVAASSQFAAAQTMPVVSATPQSARPTPAPAPRTTTGIQADPTTTTSRDETGVTQGGSSTTSADDASTQATTGQSPGAGGTAVDDGGIGAQQSGGTGTGNQVGAEGDIIITGYRRSLEDSANAKKNATNFIDSIYAEDVGKFPDLNLAESLQRLPGVVIDRDRSGEGTTVNVRGLSAGFTVTTINGFATTTSAYSGNEGRGSGLDVLPNELFRRLTLSKSPTASTVEGGTAGVIDLQPLRAFDRKGFNISLQAQAQYQDASGTTTPRAALIVSNRFDTGIGEFGILGAVAWAKRDYRSENFDTIGWTTLAVGACPNNTAGIARGCNSGNPATGGYGRGAGATLARVPGNVPASLGLGAQGSPLTQCLDGAPGGTSGLSCQDLSFALVPRLMRAEQTIGTRQRTGGLVNLEYRPIESLRFRADFLFSDVKNEFKQHQLMMVVRSYNNQIPVDFELNDDRVLTSGTFANTYFLNQSDGGNTPSDLFYRSAAMEWDVSPTLRFNVSGMMNSANLLNESLQYTIQSARPTIPLSFHPAGTPAPASTPAVNLTPNNTGQVGYYNYNPGDLTPSIETNLDLPTYRDYFWQEGRNGVSQQDLEQKSIRFDLIGGDVDSFQWSVGYMKNVFDRRISAWAGGQIAGCFTRGFCGSTFASQRPSLVEAIPDSELPNYMIELPSMELFKGAPFNAGFDNGWLVPDFDKIAQTVDLDYFRNGINPGETAESYLGSFARRDLKEDTDAAYFMLDGRNELFGMELRANAGLRYARTFQSANGRVNDFILNDGTGPTIRAFSNEYDNFLPSANFALFLRPDLVLRGAGAKTVTGVSPADLLPGFSLNLDATNYDLGNPELQPFTADNFDVGIEWYPRSRTVLTFNAWWKRIYNYPFVLRTQQPFNTLNINFDRLTTRQQEGINSLGGPDVATIQVSQRDNSDLVINLAGQEFQWVQPLDFLFKGLGFNANVTHIKQSLSGNVPAGFNPNALLAGLAPWTYNLTGYYESKIFQVRLSYVHRDATLAFVCPCDNVPGADNYNIATDYLDAQLSFPLPFYPKAAITVQAQNLLQQVSLSRFGNQEARPYNGSFAGRNFVVGLRSNF